MKNTSVTRVDEAAEALRLSRNMAIHGEKAGDIDHASTSWHSTSANKKMTAAQVEITPKTNFVDSVDESESLYNEFINFDSLDGVNIPAFVKTHNSTLNFPEKLMLMLTHVERDCAKNGRLQQDSCISWVPNGLAFVIRDKDALVKQLLPLFFGQSKFTSFTRKLYRWGFRQFSRLQNQGINRGDICFSNAYFQRDNKPIIGRMQSVTSARNRRNNHKSLFSTLAVHGIQQQQQQSQQHQHKQQQQQLQPQEQQQQRPTQTQPQKENPQQHQAKPKKHNFVYGDDDRTIGVLSNNSSVNQIAVGKDRNLGPTKNPLLQDFISSNGCRTHIVYEKHYDQASRCIDKSCQSSPDTIFSNSNKQKNGHLLSLHEAVDVLLKFASSPVS